MNRYFELAATFAIVTVFTTVIIVNAARRPTVPPPEVPSQRPAEPAPPPRPEPPEPSSEVRNAPTLDEVWREDFDDLDAWRLERGKPATIEDGIVTLHDAPSNAPMYAQKQPLGFDAADLVIRARSTSGGYIHLGVARAIEGPTSELNAPPTAPKARDGIELQMDWKTADDLSGWVKWKLDGHHWFTLPTQDAPLPAGGFTTMVVRIRPDGFGVEVDGEERGRYVIPREELRWRGGAYRIYIGATGGDPEIDFIELRPVDPAGSTAPREETT